MHFMNKLERKFGRYAINGLMKYVVACYVIGYAIEYLRPAWISWLTLEPAYIIHGLQLWRLVSWVLIPPSRSNIIFIVIMVILYYQLGTTLERTWGAFRFNCYIFGGVLYTIASAFVLYFAYHGLTGAYPLMGSGFGMYYINLTIFLAFACCYPDMKVMLYFIIPIKMKWMALVYAVFTVYDFVINSWPVRASIIGAAVNFLVFFLVVRKAPMMSPKDIRRRRHFKAQMNRGRKTQTSKSGKTGAIHKCAICGRTELDDPNLVFRYCSKCKGNYEYCQEHLFTHQHIV